MNRSERRIIVIRHPKERLSKCSLEPLRGRQEFTFLKASDRLQYDATEHLLLAMDAPLLSPDDSRLGAAVEEASDPAHEGWDPNLFVGGLRPLLLLDATWRLLPQLERCITGKPLRRSLPPWARTAYPRVSKISTDPVRGLASIEALYLALRILGEEDPDLLGDYRWRGEFLRGLQSRSSQAFSSGSTFHSE